MFNKIKIFLLLFIISFSLSACSLGEKKLSVEMDRLAEDGQYHYRNKDLGFSLVLDEDFIYYQTQRKNREEVINIEFFVPTSDKNYLQEVLGYAKLFTISIFNSDYWDGLKDDQDEKTFYRELARNGKKVYTLKFWDNIPKDWKEKWNKEKEDKIINGFSLIK